MQEEIKKSNFDSEQESYINEGNASQPMRIWKLNIPSDSILLRQKSSNVIPNPNDETLNLLIERMLITVKDSISLGVGIAAPQVGILKNIIWVQRFDKPEFPFEVYLNPIIKKHTKKKQPCMEGCLSIPNKKAETKNRAFAILLEYDKMDGTHEIEMIEDFTAVIFQHEIDHLNGIMFTDHLE
jgi:peptide deformylase